MLVELREATLLYLATARDSTDSQTAKPREAVVAVLEKAEGHAAELANLAPNGTEESLSPGVVMSKDVIELLHRTAIAWGIGVRQTAE